MAAPYSCGILLVEENADGFWLKVYHWSDLITEGEPTTPGGFAALQGLPPQLAQVLQQIAPKPDFVKPRSCAGRATVKAAIGQYIDLKYLDAPA